MERNSSGQPVEGTPEAAPEAAAREPRKKFFDARRIAYFGVFAALEVILLVWGSAIPVGATGAMLNFSLLPIVLGAILLGPLSGAFLGLVSGVVILIMVAAGAQGVFSILFLDEPVMIALICLVKTTAAGCVSGLLYRLIRSKNGTAAVFCAAAAAPVVNTGLYILGALLMSDTIAASGFADGMSAIYFLVTVAAGVNFLVEFAVNLAVSPAIYAALRAARRGAH